MNILGEPSVAPLSFSQAMFWPTGLKYMVTVEMQIQRQEERSKSSTFKQILEALHFPPWVMTLLKCYQHFDFSGILLSFFASIKKFMLDVLNDNYNDANHKKEQHLLST